MTRINHDTEQYDSHQVTTRGVPIVMINIFYLQHSVPIIYYNLNEKKGSYTELIFWKILYNT